MTDDQHREGADAGDRGSGREDERGNVASATTLYDLFDGIDGATTTAELVGLARERNADPAAWRALERLPDQEWPSLQAAVLTATTGWQ